MSAAPAIASVTRIIEQDRVDRYGDAARDHNPIHRETPEAYSGPFGRPVVHGMLVLSLVSEAMTEAFGEAWAASGALKVRWRMPAMPPVTVTARAELKHERDGVATYGVECVTAAGDVLLTGSASVRCA